MECRINKSGMIACFGAPKASVPYIIRMFEATPIAANGGLLIPRRKLLAFVNHYRDCKVHPLLRRFMEEWWSEAAVLQRCSPHMKTYGSGKFKGYQARLVARGIAKKRFAYLLDIGGGKTTISCETAKQLGPTLLITENAIWNDAYKSKAIENGKPRGDLPKWYPELKFVEIFSKNRSERVDACHQPADIYAISMHLLKGMLPEIMQMPLAAIVFDESARARNRKSQNARNLAELKSLTRYGFIETGMPSPEDLGDLWPQIDFINESVFGKWIDFARDFGERDNWDWSFKNQRKNLDALQRLRESGVCAMLSREDFWPEGNALRPVPVRVRVKMDPEQARQYAAMRDNMAVRLDDGAEVKADRVLAQTSKLRQIASGFLYDRHGKAYAIGVNPKLMALKTVLQAPPSAGGVRGQRTVIWLSFDREFALVEHLLTKLNIPFGVARSQDKASKRAQKDFVTGKIRVLVTHAQTSSHGLRWHFCSRPIYFSFGWSVEQWWQSLGRFWRPPQTEKVRPILLCCEGSIDEEIADVLVKKTGWSAIVRRELQAKTSRGTA